MIERYTLPEMGRVWSEAHKYELWCRVETLVLEAHAQAGIVAASAVEPVRDAAPPTPEAVAEIEEVTQHDVIAFLSAWADNTDAARGRRVRPLRMTSSDLLDTALALQLMDATDILLAKLDGLIAVLRDHALEHKDTFGSGRTHGIHGEPSTWGLRVADFAFGDGAVPATGSVERARLGRRHQDQRRRRHLLQHRPLGRAPRRRAARGMKAADAASQVVFREAV